QPKAPDMNLSPEDFDHDAVRQAALFWITGSGLSEEPSRSTLLELLQERACAGSAGRKPMTVLDLDYRPMFWSSAKEASRWMREALSHVTIAVGNETEVEVAIGEQDARKAAVKLLELGLELAVVKRGSEGVLAATPNSVIEVPPVRLD